MENRDFLRLVELLQEASSANAVTQAARAAENAAFQQTISELNTTIKRLN